MISSGFFTSCIPKATLVERSKVDVGQLIKMLRFENHDKLEEVSTISQGGSRWGLRPLFSLLL